jgi:hypothetical protein
MRNCCAASEYHPKNTDVSSGYGVDDGAGGHDVVIAVDVAILLIIVLY